MDRIANDSWSVHRDAAADTTVFARITMVLGPESLHVRTDLGRNNSFELVNVILSPFYF